MIFAGFVAACGFAMLVMFGEPVDWLRNLMCRVSLFRRSLLCGLCTGIQCGILMLIDPQFRYWWFPLGAGATTWIGVLTVIRLTGIDPSKETGLKGTYYRKDSPFADDPWDVVKVEKANLMYVVYGSLYGKTRTRTLAWFKTHYRDTP